MHDLNQIIANNAKAHADSINYYLNRGQHVVAEYDGVTLLTVQPFANKHEAEVFAQQELGSPSRHRKLQYARVDPVGKRDQSEDRKPTHINV